MPRVQTSARPARRAAARSENERKFRELVLYVCQKSAGDPRFGAVKLNKILYFSDFLAYANLGEPITGFEYQKLPQGPAPRRLLPIREKMMKARELGIQEVQVAAGYIQQRPVNLRAPDLSVFKAAEIAQVDRVITALADGDARTVSQISHRMVGWLVAGDNEVIPYETIFVSNEPLTELEVQRGLEVAGLHEQLAV